MTWTCRLHTISEKALRALEDYCIEASQKDPTFKFHPEIDLETGTHYIIIECPSRDSAFKRGMLFYGRYGSFFEVEWRKESDRKEA